MQRRPRALSQRRSTNLARRNGAPGVASSLKTHVGGEAVRHLFRVASSLDSLVVGEPQILGQVKDAFETAKEVGGIGKFLERAMSRALHVAKRVRSETAVGEGQVSVSSAAVDLARQIFGDLTGRVALLLGAGEMAEAAAKLLVKTGAKLLVVNRSPDRAAELAAEFGGSAIPWADLTSALVKADVVVTSTAAQGFVVTRAMTVQAMKARKGRSLFFIDIAVPRDVEPSVNDLDNVYVYDIDNLSNVVAETMRDRQSEAGRAEALVDHEAANFESWAESRNMTGTIVALRAKVRASLAGELEKSLSGRLKHLGDADRKALESMIDAAVNKLLHAPTSRIKALAGDRKVTSWSRRSTTFSISRRSCARSPSPRSLQPMSQSQRRARRIRFRSLGARRPSGDEPHPSGSRDTALSARPRPGPRLRARPRRAPPWSGRR